MTRVCIGGAADAAAIVSRPCWTLRSRSRVGLDMLLAFDHATMKISVGPSCRAIRMALVAVVSGHFIRSDAPTQGERSASGKHEFFHCGFSLVGMIADQCALGARPTGLRCDYGTWLRGCASLQFMVRPSNSYPFLHCRHYEGLLLGR